MCHEEIDISYSEKGLIECCNLIAEDLAVAKPKSNDVVDKLTEILVNRENYVCMEKGIVTQDELVNLIFQHLYSLVSREAASSHSKTSSKVSEIRAKIKLALLHNAT